MTKNELMIGNWIYHNGTPAMVYHIENQYKTVFKLNDISIDERTIQDTYTPIPLEPSLLEKCGFEQSGEVSYLMVGVLELVFEKGLVTLEQEGGSELMIPNIKYLHQLQNLMTALGTPLKITI